MNIVIKRSLTSPQHRNSKTLTIIMSPRVREANMVTQGGGRGTEKGKKEKWKSRRRRKRKKEDITFFSEFVWKHT